MRASFNSSMGSNSYLARAAAPIRARHCKRWRLDRKWAQIILFNRALLTDAYSLIRCAYGAANAEIDAPKGILVSGEGPDD
jgi:hypothetical protein